MGLLFFFNEKLTKKTLRTPRGDKRKFVKPPNAGNCLVEPKQAKSQHCLSKTYSCVAIVVGSVTWGCAKFHIRHMWDKKIGMWVTPPSNRWGSGGLVRDTRT